MSFVKCNSKRQSELLLKRDGSVFIDRPVKVEIHRNLNSCKGVIRCRDLNQLSEVGEIKKCQVRVLLMSVAVL